MIGIPTLDEVFAHLRDVRAPLPDDAEIRAAREIDAQPTTPPVWLDGLLFVGGVFASFLGFLCFWPLLGMPALIAAAALIGLVLATGLRWMLPREIGRIAAAPLAAIALAARFALLGALYSLGLPDALVRLAWLGLELALLLAYPDRANRVLCAVLAAVALMTLSDELDIPSGVDVVLGLAVVVAFALIAIRPWISATALRHVAEPVSLGVAVVGLAGMGRFWKGWFDEGWIPVVGSATGVLAIAVVVLCLIRARADPMSWVVTLLGTSLLVALGIGLPGLSASLAFVLLALLARDLPLLIVSALSLIIFGTWAYYLLDAPVWIKTGALVGSGVVLLAMRAYLRSRVRRPTEELA